MQKMSLLTDQQAYLLRLDVQSIRANMSALFNALDQPISFFYIHFICLISAIYLPLFAVSTALDIGFGDEVHWTANILGAILVVLQNVFVIGLRILGQKMNDPYGDDIEDLSVIYYVTSAHMASMRVLASKVPEPFDPVAEENMRHEFNSSMGKAYMRQGPSADSGYSDEGEGSQDSAQFHDSFHESVSEGPSF